MVCMNKRCYILWIIFLFRLHVKFFPNIHNNPYTVHGSVMSAVFSAVSSVCSDRQSCFRFSQTNGLFAAMHPNVGHPSICSQSAQVLKFFSRTQLCTGQNLSQNSVLAPSTRQPVQLIISGVIVTPLSFVHKSAVFLRRALSFVIVAILASQVSQSSPQQPIVR